MARNKMRIDPLFEDLVNRKQRRFEQKGFVVSKRKITKLIAIENQKLPPQQRRWEIKIRRLRLIR